MGQSVEMGTIHVGDFMRRFCSNLGMTNQTVKAAQEFVQTSEEFDIRRSSAAAVIKTILLCGLGPQEAKTDYKEALKLYALVFDAVHTPKITRLLREAGECGAKIVTGVEMFIGQAYEQYERFTELPDMV